MVRGSSYLLAFLTLSSTLWAAELTACYTAKYLFLPVAVTCITYSQKGDKLHISSWVKTVNVGKLVKRVYNYGNALVDLNPIRPISFFYHQEEGTFKREQFYHFQNGRIKVREVKYEDLTNNIQKEEVKEYVYTGYVEPYTASLTLYANVKKTSAGKIKMFYDDKNYEIPYQVVGKELVRTPAGNFESVKVLVNPNIQTKGLLRPTGQWTLWLDDGMLLPVKMQLSFVIGSVKAELESIEGDRDLLRRVLLKE
ncbi:hypothetical protein Thal_1067 [Thermocrinis albus DSM 14484]|uniref:DUF3108 domain-containing protein n=1 Tax=Thermocrinis albus (strain DSM 14484 / JCM 11386 / HI 11/12) TaxID=638303 RepID=D3SLR9_THEAH|nr:DUF3108 domain-containing protein [Thermocrinis albus]ADC89699.1 hypothetical protein Thal_1067 [Thermocrinis albus DSM 14484]